jgi:hypothetical protein
MKSIEIDNEEVNLLGETSNGRLSKKRQSSKIQCHLRFGPLTFLRSAAAAFADKGVAGLDGVPGESTV